MPATRLSALASTPISIPARPTKRLSKAIGGQNTRPVFAYSAESSICNSPTWGYRGKDKDKIEERHDQEKAADVQYWRRRKVQQDDEALAEELKKARGQITEAVRKAKEDHKRRRDEEKSAAATGGVFAQRPLSRLTKRQSLFRSSRLLSSREPTPAEASNQTALGEILPFSQTGASVPFSVPTTPGSTASAPTTAPTTPAAPASPSPRQTHTSPLPQGPEGYFPTATSSVESLDSPPRSASSSASDPSVLDASTAQTTPDISRPSTLNSEATVSARSMVAKMFAWTRRSRPSK